MWTAVLQSEPMSLHHRLGFDMSAIEIGGAGTSYRAVRELMKPEPHSVGVDRDDRSSTSAAGRYPAIRVRRFAALARPHTQCLSRNLAV